MCDWPKSDCDVSVTDRQTNTLRFWPITFESRALVFGELHGRIPLKGNGGTPRSAGEGHK